MKGNNDTFDERARACHGAVPVPSKRNRIGSNLLYVSRRTRASQSRRNLVLFPVWAITASVLWAVWAQVDDDDDDDDSACACAWAATNANASPPSAVYDFQLLTVLSDASVADGYS